MDYTRPDNINNQLSEVILKDNSTSGMGVVANNNKRINILIIVLILSMFIGLAYWWYVSNNKVLTINIPITNNPLNNGRPITNTPYIRSTSTSATSTSATNTSNILPGIEQIFYTLWPDAITGYSYVKNFDTASTNTSNISNSIIFQDKITGHIYRADALDYKPYKIANTTINNLFLSHFANNGKTIIFQTLNQNTNTLSTYIADISNNYINNINIKDSNLNNGVSPQNLENKSFLGDNVSDFDVSPDGQNIAYISIDKNYNSVINILNVNTRKIKILSSYNLPDIHVDYFSSSTLSIYQYPDQDKITQAYNVNLSTGNIYPIIKAQGLEIKANTKGVIYSDYSGLFIDHMASSSKGKITYKTSFYTRSNKCDWSSSGAFVLCGVDKAYTNKKLNTAMNNTYISNDSLYMYGISFPEERMIYNFNNYISSLNKYEKINVNIHSMKISNDSNLLTIMDHNKGLYMLKIYPLLSAENN